MSYGQYISAKVIKNLINVQFKSTLFLKSLNSNKSGKPQAMSEKKHNAIQPLKLNKNDASHYRGNPNSPNVHRAVKINPLICVNHITAKYI